MPGLQEEIYNAVKDMLENIKLLSNRSPEAKVDALKPDFRTLLARSKEAFPEVRTIQEMSDISRNPTLVELVTKLSAMKGAMRSALYGG